VFVAVVGPLDSLSGLLTAFHWWALSIMSRERARQTPPKLAHGLFCSRKTLGRIKSLRGLKSHGLPRECFGLVGHALVCISRLGGRGSGRLIDFVPQCCILCTSMRPFSSTLGTPGGGTACRSAHFHQFASSIRGTRGGWRC
jgi:hypothetical protein